MRTPIEHTSEVDVLVPFLFDLIFIQLILGDDAIEFELGRKLLRVVGKIRHTNKYESKSDEMLSIANGGCASPSARVVVAARRRGGKKTTRRAGVALMSSFAKSNSAAHQKREEEEEEQDKNVFAKVAATTALALTMISAPPPSSFAAFDSKTSQSLADDAKEYRVELSSQGVTGSIKINSKLNRSLQETVTFDFSDVKGLAPNTKHGINIHDETTGKSWNPEVRRER